MAVLSVLAFVAPAADILAQAPTDGAAAKGVSRADAYYHFSMGHLYTELAGAYGNRGTYLSKAIDHFKLAIQADPGFATAYGHLGVACYADRNYEDAVRYLEKAVELGQHSRRADQLEAGAVRRHPGVAVIAG